MKFGITDQQVEAVRDMSEEIHESCIAAGWYTDIEIGNPLERNIPEMLALIHSEISEALEGYRKDLMDDHLPNRKNVEVELADAIIRILDLGGYLKLDVAGAIQEKFQYNQVRADHKIENRLKPGGKKI
jgi:NTP pyrophosphatase (non-canonical NTP hydrolase)